MTARNEAPAIFNRVLRLPAPEWRRLLAGCACVALGGAASLAYPQAIRLVVDHALAPDDSSTTSLTPGTAAAAMVALALVQGLAAAISHYQFELSGERAVARLRRQLFASILDQEVAFFDEARTGELTSRLSSDTEVLQGAVSRHLPSMLTDAVTIAGGVGMLIYTSPALTGLMVVVVPPVVLAAVFYGRRVERVARDAQDAVADASGVAEEGIAGIRTVRAFGAEPREVARYSGAIDRALAAARRRMCWSAGFLCAAVAATYSGVATMFWYGSRLVSAGGLTMGELTSFLVYTLFVAVALGSLGGAFGELSRVGGAATRVFELIDRTPRIVSGASVVATSAAGRITFQQVDFSYPSRPSTPVLVGIDAEVAPGETIALVGPSGAGKTSLALLIARFYDPVRGSVQLDGIDIRNFDLRWLQQQIGIVSQEPILFSGTIGDNIRYGNPEAPVSAVQAAADAANAADFIARLPDAYATQVGERGLRLSGGQKQRIAIARAVLKNPRLLILDEATSALDTESEHLVKEALARLMRGRTSIVIAHRLSTVRHADRVLVLDAGRIVEAGNHATLMQQSVLYRRLVERQLADA